MGRTFTNDNGHLFRFIPIAVLIVHNLEIYKIGAVYLLLFVIVIRDSKTSQKLLRVVFQYCNL